MRRAAIVDFVRTPFFKGRGGGTLVNFHPVDLYSLVLQGLIKRNEIDPRLIDDVITGCVLQVGEQAGNIGRQAVLAAGLPESVPAVTIDRKCGSAQQAFDFAAQGIIAGAYDVVIAGGVEMMSLIPMKMNRMGKDSEGKNFKLRYPEGMVHQGIAAERIASKWQFSRNQLDEFALASHQKAVGDESKSQDIIGVPIDTEFVCEDEGIRKNSSLEALSALPPAFENAEWKKRFPEINWSVTAGNSSPVSDGACAALVVEESIAMKMGLTPRCIISHFAVAGDDPMMLLTGIIPATKKLLDKAGVKLSDIHAYEVNEAFASVPLAWQKELGANPEFLNTFGGAIALGHPVGASGGRLFGNIMRSMEQSKSKYGLITMCESGGMANATLLERA